MLAYYGDRISPNMTRTPEGFLVCHNVPIARTGEMEYLASELQLDGDPERIVTVTRDSPEVFSQGALASFEGKPVTDAHPPEDVTPENFSGYAKGHVQNVRQEGAHMVADLHLTDSCLISRVESGVMREVSCGYHCTYEPNEDGTFSQKRIRGNHVAVVPNGRAGKSVSIKDSAFAETEKIERRRHMKRTKTQSILAMFGLAAKDAAPETIEKMVQDAAAVLDAEPAEGVETKPAEDVAPPTAPQGGLEAKLDELLSMLKTALKPKDEAPADPAPEEKLDKAIDELSGKEGSAETVTDEEASEEHVTSDAALAGLLKSARPAIAAIKDEEDRKRVTDALLKAINPHPSNRIPAILKATRDAARQAAQDAEPIDTKTQQAFYDARNPHKMKEEK